jgi:hypothetical protein
MEAWKDAVKAGDAPAFADLLIRALIASGHGPGKVLDFSESVATIIRDKAAASKAMDSALSIKQKLTIFYQQNDPGKLPQIDTILASFKGREEELLDKLEKAKASRRESAAQQDTIRHQVVEYYKKYDPEKVPQVDNIMGQFKGREKDLLQMLKQAEIRRKSMEGMAPSPEQLSLERSDSAEEKKWSLIRQKSAQSQKRKVEEKALEVPVVPVAAPAPDRGRKQSTSLFGGASKLFGTASKPMNVKKEADLGAGAGASPRYELHNDDYDDSSDEEPPPPMYVPNSSSDEDEDESGFADLILAQKAEAELGGGLKLSKLHEAMAEEGNAPWAMGAQLAHAGYDDDMPQTRPRKASV